MSEYDWSQFRVHMYYLAPIEDVFLRFSTQRGLESFFVYRAALTGSDGTNRSEEEVVKPGDGYVWTYTHHYQHGGEFTSVEENRLVAFTFGEMHVVIKLREVAGATEVELHQTGCATEDPARAWQHLNCRSCWIYFLMNLRSVLAGGPDLRDFAHPNWNDSISIGFDPNAVPGAPRPR